MKNKKRCLFILIICISISFLHVGGCGGGGGALDTPLAPDPVTCQVPPLNTNFSDSIYFFVDLVANIVLGVTSTGEDVIISAADIIPDPTIVVLAAEPLGINLALIFLALIEDIFFDASGEAVRVADGTLFQVNDLIVATVPLGVDIEGECDSVESLDIDLSLNKSALTEPLASSAGVGTRLYVENMVDGNTDEGIITNKENGDIPAHIENLVVDVLTQNQ